MRQYLACRLLTLHLTLHLIAASCVLYTFTRRAASCVLYTFTRRLADNHLQLLLCCQKECALWQVTISMSCIFCPSNFGRKFSSHTFPPIQCPSSFSGPPLSAAGVEYWGRQIDHQYVTVNSRWCMLGYDGTTWALGNATGSWRYGSTRWV